MDNLDLAAIRARCDAATPGPWGYECQGCYEDHDEAYISLPYDNFEISRLEDAKFIAAARTDIPALLSEVERLTAERDAAVADLHECAAEADKYCHYCKYDENGNPSKETLENHCYHCGWSNPSDENYDEENETWKTLWQWRGVPAAVRLTNKENAE